MNQRIVTRPVRFNGESGALSCGRLKMRNRLRNSGGPLEIHQGPAQIRAAMTGEMASAAQRAAAVMLRVGSMPATPAERDKTKSKSP